MVHATRFRRQSRFQPGRDAAYTGAVKAIVISKLGGPQGLEVREFPEPEPAPGERIVQVRAGGLNFADLLMVTGGYPGTPAPPLVVGREYCGMVEDSADPVMGYTQWGAFAEKLAAHPKLMWPLPQGWSVEEGSAFPVNYFTAYLAYWKAGLTENPNGARVLIQAVAGGVGTAAVQIGRLLGIEMYGTSSSDEKLTRVKALGLHYGINYKQRDYVDAIKELTKGEGVDVVLEMLGGEHVAKAVRCLRDFGRVIVYGSATGEAALLDTKLLYPKGASVHGLWLTYLSQNRTVMEPAWKQLSAWAAEGQLHPVIGQVLPMEKALAGYRLLQEGKNFGKVVLKIS